ncbi:MAG: hypothetical protein V7K91_23250 [Nostoc sp.]
MFEDKRFSICIVVLSKCDRLHCECGGRLVNAIACIANANDCFQKLTHLFCTLQRQSLQ